MEMPQVRNATDQVVPNGLILGRPRSLLRVDGWTITYIEEDRVPAHRKARSTSTASAA